MIQHKAFLASPVVASALLLSLEGIKQFEDVADQVTVLRDRIEEGDPVDIYKTGYPRHVFW